MPEPRARWSRLLPTRTARPAAGAERLDLWLPGGWPQAGLALAWRRLRRDGDSTGGRCARLEELPAEARTPELYVWTPAADTLLTEINLPTRSRRAIEQALPYALEEQVLGEPESLHYAWRREDDGRLAVAVTARARLAAWREAFAAAGLAPRALCPAMLAVPWALDCWSALFRDGELLVRRGAVAGFACQAEAGQPPALLAGALHEAGQAGQLPECLVLFEAPAALRADTWSAALGVPVRIEKQSPWERQPAPRPPLNLLQGEFAPHGTWRDAWRRFWPAAALLALWLVSTVAADTLEWWQLRHAYAAANREMTAILLDAFPETKTVLDPPAQMARNLEALQARSGTAAHDLLPLLARVTPLLRADPGLRPRGLRYAERTLTLELTAPAQAGLDGLRERLRATGLRAELLAVTPRAGELDARLRIQPEAPPTR
jgi:general secretion pathway protein L